MRNWVGRVALVVAAVLGLIAIVGVVVSTNGRPRTEPVLVPYSPSQIQADAAMTQQMSTPNATGPMQQGTIPPDPQLVHAQDPAFLRELEQYEARVDRMLARPGP